MLQCFKPGVVDKFLINLCNRAYSGFGANWARASSGLWLIQCGRSIDPVLTGSGLGPFQLIFDEGNHKRTWIISFNHLLPGKLVVFPFRWNWRREICLRGPGRSLWRSLSLCSLIETNLARLTYRIFPILTRKCLCVSRRRQETNLRIWTISQ